MREDTGYNRPPATAFADKGRLLHGAGLLQYVFGEIGLHRGLVADGLIVGSLQQLFAAVAELFAYGLLHARVFEFALPRNFPADQLYDAETEKLTAIGIEHWQHYRVLPGLELSDGFIGGFVALQ
jgi:hypothetical protein